MANTPNYNLKKVEYTEIADIPAHFNGNMDMIDTTMKTNADAAATKETPAGAQAKVDALAGEGNTKTVKQIDDELIAHKADYAKEATEFTIASDEIYNRTVRYYKKNGFVFLSLRDIQKKDSSEFILGEYIAVLPVGFRPKQNSYVQGISQTTSVSKPISLIIYSTGQVQIAQSTSDTSIRLSFSFYAGGGTV